MRLISRRSKLPYGGKVYKMGETFEASDVHGRLLILVRVADLATADTGSYARADLQPQTVSGELPEHSVYVRRDMQAAPIIGELTAPVCRADLSERRPLLTMPVKRKRGRPPKVKHV